MQDQWGHRECQGVRERRYGSKSIVQLFSCCPKLWKITFQWSGVSIGTDDKRNALANNCLEKSATVFPERRSKYYYINVIDRKLLFIFIKAHWFDVKLNTVFQSIFHTFLYMFTSSCSLANVRNFIIIICSWIVEGDCVAENGNLKAFFSLMKNMLFSLFTGNGTSRLWSF